MKTLLIHLLITVCPITLLAHSGHHHTASTQALHRIEVKGDRPLDHKLRHHQARLAKEPNNVALLENLGWLFVSKARLESSHEHYAHAIQCAQQLGCNAESKHQGQLMLGHLYLQEHRFAEAKKVAQALVDERGWHYDHGLLGDILLDLGDTQGATEAYQAMMQQRPGLESYARAAMIRWQLGKLDGAIAAMELAVSAGSLRNPEPLAWAYSKLAGYCLQKGDLKQARSIAEQALTAVPQYPHAQLMRGRILMAEKKFALARPFLEQAAETLPEPAFLWALRDCLVSLGQAEAVSNVEERLHETGPASDPRTYALYLATVDEKLDLALSLATSELSQRQDIHTQDALAWASHRLGQDLDAQAAMSCALGDGTRDPRLSLHAGLIATRSGMHDEAAEHLAAAERDRFLLLPSELKLLHKQRNESSPQN